MHTYTSTDCENGVGETIAGLGVDPSRSNIVLKLSADKSLVFK